MRKFIGALSLAAALAPFSAVQAGAQGSKPLPVRQVSVVSTQSPRATQLAMRSDAPDRDSLQQELGRLREEVARLSLDAMIRNILVDEAMAAANLRKD